MLRNGLALGLVALAQAAHGQEFPSSVLLPNAALVEHLATPLPSGSGPAAVDGQAAEAEPFIGFAVPEFPEDSIFSGIDEDGAYEQPLVSANRLTILLNPNLGPEEADQALEDYDLERITEERTEALRLIGAVVVDASEALEAMNGEPSLTLEDPVELAETPVVRLARRLQSDPRFVAVAPDSPLTSHQMRDALEPQEVELAPADDAVEMGAGSDEDMPTTEETAAADEAETGADLDLASDPALGESEDWGLGDIGVVNFWSDLEGPFLVGVIDVGFDSHEDLDFEPALPGQLSKHDHGNHVLGIMCAGHNGIGVKGVLPDCSGRVSSGAFLLSAFSPRESQRDQVSGFSVLFSELVATSLDFIVAQPDVKTINLSLGFNWMPNFGIDPRAPAAEPFRNMIRVQGRFFASVLAFAKQRDVALVAAAGNDSRNLATPLPAMWASPFNFGSFLIENVDGWSNGLVVEAHTKDHTRAPFSNSDGHISCPGVDVLSTLARGPSSYGSMSGTSMASPYCAAALEALRNLRPDLSLQASIDCLRSSPDLIENRVPRLNLAHAINECEIGPIAEAQP
jgi:hypothetical protein